MRTLLLLLLTILAFATPAFSIGRLEPGQPKHCPARWCGCWLATHFGLKDKALWKASNWARRGKRLSRPVPGAVVVWKNHVGKVTAVKGNRIRVLSGNDGNRIKNRWRTTRGVIAWRVL